MDFLTKLALFVLLLLIIRWAIGAAIEQLGKRFAGTKFQIGHVGLGSLTKITYEATLPILKSVLEQLSDKDVPIPINDDVNSYSGMVTIDAFSVVANMLPQFLKQDQHSNLPKSRLFTIYVDTIKISAIQDLSIDVDSPIQDDLDATSSNQSPSSPSSSSHSSSSKSSEKDQQSNSKLKQWLLESGLLFLSRWFELVVDGVQIQIEVPQSTLVVSFPRTTINTFYSFQKNIVDATLDLSTSTVRIFDNANLDSSNVSVSSDVFDHSISDFVYNDDQPCGPIGTCTMFELKPLQVKAKITPRRKRLVSLDITCQGVSINLDNVLMSRMHKFLCTLALQPPLFPVKKPKNQDDTAKKPKAVAKLSKTSTFFTLVPKDFSLNWKSADLNLSDDKGESLTISSTDIVVRGSLKFNGPGETNHGSETAQFNADVNFVGPLISCTNVSRPDGENDRRAPNGKYPLLESVGRVKIEAHTVERLVKIPGTEDMHTSIFIPHKTNVDFNLDKLKVEQQSQAGFQWLLFAWKLQMIWQRKFKRLSMQVKSTVAQIKSAQQAERQRLLRALSGDLSSSLSTETSDASVDDKQTGNIDQRESWMYASHKISFTCTDAHIYAQNASGNSLAVLSFRELALMGESSNQSSTSSGPDRVLTSSQMMFNVQLDDAMFSHANVAIPQSFTDEYPGCNPAAIFSIENISAMAELNLLEKQIRDVSFAGSTLRSNISNAVVKLVVEWMDCIKPFLSKSKKYKQKAADLKIKHAEEDGIDLQELEASSSSSSSKTTTRQPIRGFLQDVRIFVMDDVEKPKAGVVKLSFEIINLEDDPTSRQRKTKMQKVALCFAKTSGSGTTTSLGSSSSSSSSSSSASEPSCTNEGFHTLLALDLLELSRNASTSHQVTNVLRIPKVDVDWDMATHFGLIKIAFHFANLIEVNKHSLGLGKKRSRSSVKSKKSAASASADQQSGASSSSSSSSSVSSTTTSNEGGSTESGDANDDESQVTEEEMHAKKSSGEIDLDAIVTQGLVRSRSKRRLSNAAITKALAKSNASEDQQPVDDLDEKPGNSFAVEIDNVHIHASFRESNTVTIDITDVRGSTSPAVIWSIKSVDVVINDIPTVNVSHTRLELSEQTDVNAPAMLIVAIEGFDFHLEYDFNLGAVIDDIQWHLKASNLLVNKLKNADASSNTSKPFPPMHISIQNVSVEFADDPFQVRLTMMHTLGSDQQMALEMLDETLEEKLDQMASAGRAVSADQKQQLKMKMFAKHSERYKTRINYLIEQSKDRRFSLLKADIGSVNLVVRHDSGLMNPVDVETTLMSLDSVGAESHHFLDHKFSELWGRRISMDLQEIEVNLRDFSKPLLKMDSINMDGVLIAGQVEYDSAFVYQQFNVVADRLKVKRSISPMKFYHDLTCDVKGLKLAHGLCYQPVLAEVSLAANRLSPPSQDPSAPLAFWDKLRYMFHGNMQMAMKGFEFDLITATNPYDLSRLLVIEAGKLHLDINHSVKLGQEQDKSHSIALKFDHCKLDFVKTIGTLVSQTEIVQWPKLDLTLTFDWINSNVSPSTPEWQRCHYVRPQSGEGVAKGEFVDTFLPFRSTNVDIELSLDTHSSFMTSMDLKLNAESASFFKYLSFLYAQPPLHTRVSTVLGQKPKKPPQSSLPMHFRNLTANVVFQGTNLHIEKEDGFGLRFSAQLLEFAGELKMLPVALRPLPPGIPDHRKSVKSWQLINGTVFLATPEMRFLTEQGQEAFQQRMQEKHAELLFEMHHGNANMSTDSLNASTANIGNHTFADDYGGDFFFSANTVRYSMTNPDTRRNVDKSNRDGVTGETLQKEFDNQIVVADVKMLWTMQLRKTLSVWIEVLNNLTSDSLDRIMEDDMQSGNVQKVAGRRKRAATAAHLIKILNDFTDPEDLEQNSSPSQSDFLDDQWERKKLKILEVGMANLVTFVNFVRPQIKLVDREAGSVLLSSENSTVTVCTQQDARGTGVDLTKIGNEWHNMQMYTVTANNANVEDEFGWLEDELDVYSSSNTTGDRFQKVIDKTKMLLGYTYFTAKIGSQDFKTNDEEAMDTVTLILPDLPISLTGDQFTIMNNVISTVLLTRLEKHVDWEDEVQANQYMNQLNPETANGYTSLSAELKELRSAIASLENNMRMIQQSLDPSSKSLLMEMESDLEICRQEYTAKKRSLKIFVQNAKREKAQRGSRSMDSGNGGQGSSSMGEVSDEENVHDFKIEYFVENASWIMLSPEGNPLAGLNLARLDGTMYSNEDNSGLQMINLQELWLQSERKDQPFVDLLTLNDNVPSKTKQNNGSSEWIHRPPMLRLYIKKNAPVAGIPNYENLQINVVFPVVIQLTKLQFEDISRYFFPEATEATGDDMEEMEVTSRSRINTSEARQSLDIRRGGDETAEEGGKKKRGHRRTRSFQSGNEMTENNTETASDRKMSVKNADVTEMMKRASNNVTFNSFSIPQVDMTVTFRGEGTFQKFDRWQISLDTIAYNSVTLSWTDLYVKIYKDILYTLVPQTFKQKLRRGGSDKDTTAKTETGQTASTPSGFSKVKSFFGGNNKNDEDGDDYSPGEVEARQKAQLLMGSIGAQSVEKHSRFRRSNKSDNANNNNGGGGGGGNINVNSTVKSSNAGGKPPMTPRLNTANKDQEEGSQGALLASVASASSGRRTLTFDDVDEDDQESPIASEKKKNPEEKAKEQGDLESLLL